MPLVFRFAARSDVGMVRSKNDDSAYAGRYLAVVADGMGGHAGGNIASASTVLDLVHLDRAGYEGDAGTQLADEIQTANSLLSELVTTNPHLAGMGTTVTALLLSGKTLNLAHIGDSRAYRLKDGKFEQITTDHTFVQRLIDEGRLKPEEAAVHPHKNVLMRVLGDVDASPELDIASFNAEPGERWLLCSDGLNAVLGDDAVERVLRENADLSECVDTLVELTLAGGSPDNVTVAMVEFVDAEAEISPVPPTALPPARTAAGERGSAQSTEPPAGTAPEVAIRADLIRKDLLSREHVLVGSAALATETGQIPIVTQRSTERRAAMMLTHKAEATTNDDDGLPEKRRRWLAPAFLTLVGLILVSVLGFGYTWTQTRYYVGAYENHVAIFNGVSQSIGPLPLSRVDSITDIPVSNLPEYQRSRISSTLPAGDLAEAERIVADLRSELRAVGCPGSDTTRPTESPSATATPDASPSPAARSTSTASAAASAIATASAVATTPSSTASGSSATATPTNPAPNAGPANCGGKIQ